MSHNKDAILTSGALGQALGAATRLTMETNQNEKVILTHSQLTDKYRRCSEVQEDFETEVWGPSKHAQSIDTWRHGETEVFLH